jgi:hypothetical protein
MIEFMFMIVFCCTRLHAMSLMFVARSFLIINHPVLPQAYRVKKLIKLGKNEWKLLVLKGERGLKVSFPSATEVPRYS